MKTTSTALLAIALLAATSANAATIRVEAESFFSTSGSGTGGAGFTIENDTTAGTPLGGSYITTASNETGSPPVNTASYGFTVDVADAGSGYNLYMRVAVGPDGFKGADDDSIHLPGTMGLSPSSWITMNGFSNGSGDVVSDVDGNTPEDSLDFFWINVTDPTGILVDAPTYTLTSGSNYFVLGGREDGFRIDSLVFSTDAALTSTELNNAALATVIPEPSSLALLGLGSLLLLRRRR